MNLAIDFGLSNTDSVLIKKSAMQHRSKSFSGDPSGTLIEEIISSHHISTEDLNHIVVTGGKHYTLPEELSGRSIVPVNEIAAIGRGGQAILKLSPEKHDESVLVVSAGSGTAMISANGKSYQHVTGTAVGGGTLLGLGRLLIDSVDPLEIGELALAGDPNGADLSIADVISGPIGKLPPTATAVNFGRLARETKTVSRQDLAAALINMTAQIIAIIALNASRAINASRIVFTGHLTDMALIRSVLQKTADLYGQEFITSEKSGYATALGALLHFEENSS